MYPFRIIFMGTPEFAVPSLEILHTEGFSIAAVVTAPDKPAGRGLKMHHSAVKEFALKKGLPLFQPQKLSDPLFIETIGKLKADLGVVVAFRVLPDAVWSMPRMGTINLHASLLPQYRGAAPINRAIINGEKETGVTTFFIRKEIDTGNILLAEKIQIGENETAGELHDRLKMMGAGLLLKTVKAIEENTYSSTEQNKLTDTSIEWKTAPKIFPSDCRINWHSGIVKIHNFIRGLSPSPGASTYFISPVGDTLPVKIFRALKKNNSMGDPGTLSSDGKCLAVTVEDGSIEIVRLQQSGKKILSTEEFLRGFRMEKGWRVDS